MKISLIELDFHHDVVDGFCRTFSNTEHHVSFFLIQSVYDKIKHNSYINAKNYSWIIFSDGNRKNFLRNNIGLINNADCIFFNTISSEPEAYFSVKFTPITIMRVHNAYKLFAPWQHLKLPLQPYYIWKAFSYTLRELLWGKYLFYAKRLPELVDFFSFPDPIIAEYCINQNLVQESKVTPFFPFKVYEPNTVRKESAPSLPLTISIIGAVDNRRRNYEDIVDAIRVLPGATSIMLNLLGKADNNYSKKIIADLQALGRQNLKINYYIHSVPQKEFDELVNQTDLIISPLKVFTLTEIYGEIYGQTKTSGTILDSIRFPIPIVLPADYQLNTDQKKYFKQYHTTEELSKIIQYFSENRTELHNITLAYRNHIQEDYSSGLVARKIIDFIGHKKRQH